LTPVALVVCIVLALLIFRWLQPRKGPPMIAAPAFPQRRESDAHLWVHARWTSQSAHESWSLDMRAMTLTLERQLAGLGADRTVFLARRTSPVQWEMKLHPGYREQRIAELRRMLAADEAGTVDEAIHQEELDNLEPEPAWHAFPEEFVASIETSYQRYRLAPERG
jgi:hypothetical protein